MEGKLQKSHQARVLPNDLADLPEGEILYDRHRRECYQVTSVDDFGVALHQDGTDFYVPCSLFVSWYGRRLFSIDETRSIEAPEWCSRRDEPEGENSLQSCST